MITIEENILLFLQNVVRNPVLDAFFKQVTALGDAGFIWILCTLLLLFIKKTRKIGIMCAIALIASLLLNNLVLKNLIARPRPFDAISGLKILIDAPHDFSFPSGHTASSFAAATVLFMTLPKKYGIPAMILAFLISFSRLYLGVHYPTDVLAGMISGIAIALITVYTFKRKGL